MQSGSDLSAYKEVLKPIIETICNRPEKEYQHEGTIFGDNSVENIDKLKAAFEIKQKQMKEGDIAQKCIGLFPGWEDLGKGHETGLDCRRIDNSIIAEIKNKYNTINSGSGKTVKDKLANYKKKYPETRCILGIINPKIGCKNLITKFMHNGVELEKIEGIELFKLVFTNNDHNYADEVLEFVRIIMYQN